MKYIFGNFLTFSLEKRGVVLSVVLYSGQDGMIKLFIRIKVTFKVQVHLMYSNWLFQDASDIILWLHKHSLHCWFVWLFLHKPESHWQPPFVSVNQPAVHHNDQSLRELGNVKTGTNSSDNSRRSQLVSSSASIKTFINQWATITAKPD